MTLVSSKNLLSPRDLEALTAGYRELGATEVVARAHVENLRFRVAALAARVSQAEEALRGWAEVLETCLPTDEGYDDDTEQVLGNVIRSIRALAASSAGEPE